MHLLSVLRHIIAQIWKMAHFRLFGTKLAIFNVFLWGLIFGVPFTFTWRYFLLCLMIYSFLIHFHYGTQVSVDLYLLGLVSPAAQVIPVTYQPIQYVIIIININLQTNGSPRPKEGQTWKLNSNSDILGETGESFVTTGKTWCLWRMFTE